MIPLKTSNLVGALSMALDFTYSGLSEHHKKVAYIALQTGRAMGFNPDSLRELYHASSLHDIGAITFGEKTRLAEFEVENPHEHCRRGCQFLRDSDIFSPVAEIVLSHHDHWDGGGNSIYSGGEIPLPGRIIHLADRVDVLIRPDRYILEQRKEIMGRIEKLSGSVFDPEVFEAFSAVAASESFWLDIASNYLGERIDELIEECCNFTLAGGNMRSIAKMFSKVIDSKSIFTIRHSGFVSSVAAKLSALLGFNGEEREMMAVAGFLHDLGKLSIPEEILEKPGRLTGKEYRIIKQHTYHTYHILNRIDGFDEIKEWAAYHHEKIDGTGYPFRLDGDRLSIGARVMAVSDIFAALVEDRPYRPGMRREMVRNILTQAVKDRAIDRDITELVFERYGEFEELKFANGA